jgi:hypothetical protein
MPDTCTMYRYLISVVILFITDITTTQSCNCTACDTNCPGIATSCVARTFFSSDTGNCETCPQGY